MFHVKRSQDEVRLIRNAWEATPYPISLFRLAKRDPLGLAFTVSEIQIRDGAAA